MTHPRFPARQAAPLLGLLLILTAGDARAQRRTPISKPGDTVRAPFQSPAARAAPRRPEPTRRPDTVALPYNLVWGDSQSRLAALFGGVGAQITAKKTTGESEVWTVQGLIAPGLEASLFTFSQGILAALEFDYSKAEWDTAKYNDIMGQLRRQMEGIFGGPGEMVSRQTEQPADSNIKQTFTGYQWKRGDTLVQLFYFSAESEDKAQNYRTISVHYHYQETPMQGDPQFVSPLGSAPAADGSADGKGAPAVSVPSDPAKPQPPRPPADSDALPER